MSLTAGLVIVFIVLGIAIGSWLDGPRFIRKLR